MMKIIDESTPFDAAKFEAARGTLRASIARLAALSIPVVFTPLAGSAFREHVRRMEQEEIKLTALARVFGVSRERVIEQWKRTPFDLETFYNFCAKGWITIR